MGATNRIISNRMGNTIKGLYNNMSSHFETARGNAISVTKAAATKMGYALDGTGQILDNVASAAATASAKAKAVASTVSKYGNATSHKIQNELGTIDMSGMYGVAGAVNQTKNNALNFISNNKKTVGGVAGILGVTGIGAGIYSGSDDD